MVLPSKIFKIKEDTSLELIAQKLRGFREEERYKVESGKTVTLVTEILDLKFEKGSVHGIFSKDFAVNRIYKREVVEDFITEEAPFRIVDFEGRLMLVVLVPSGGGGGKKLIAGNIANKLGEVLSGKSGAIVEGRISHETLRELHESNPQATKLIWFDDVDIPGVEKLCLAGSDVVHTQLYRSYLEHGRIWYVVFEVQKRGIVVGITRNCVVTLFSKSTADEVMNYVSEELLTLIE